ncbi:hypothetical protein [Mycetohabitans rhizoxinica]|uniref:hypothetical protein n=1 Tax=Mycetohabitans rhizoxinica TaxID=412963 RepID=UPI0030D306B9
MPRRIVLYRLELIHIAMHRIGGVCLFSPGERCVELLSLHAAFNDAACLAVAACRSQALGKMVHRGRG